MSINLTKNPEFTKEPQWDMFRGNNHSSITGHTIHKGGSVDLADYVGELLSRELWNDLINRMWITSLGIFEYDEPEWLLGYGPGRCDIRLDKDRKISSIRFYPHVNYPPAYTEDELVEAMVFALQYGDNNHLQSLYDMIQKRRNTPWVIYESIGDAIIGGSIVKQIAENS